MDLILLNLVCLSYSLCHIYQFCIIILQVHGVMFIYQYLMILYTYFYQFFIFYRTSQFSHVLIFYDLACLSYTECYNIYQFFMYYNKCHIYQLYIINCSIYQIFIILYEIIL